MFWMNNWYLFSIFIDEYVCTFLDRDNSVQIIIIIIITKLSAVLCYTLHDFHNRSWIPSFVVPFIDTLGSLGSKGNKKPSRIDHKSALAGIEGIHSAPLGSFIPSNIMITVSLKLWYRFDGASWLMWYIYVIETKDTAVMTRTFFKKNLKKLQAQAAARKSWERIAIWEMVFEEWENDDVDEGKVKRASKRVRWWNRCIAGRTVTGI